MAVVLLASCNSKKVATEATTDATAETKTMSMNAKEMIKNGFTMGTIEESKAEGDCPFVIRIEGEDKPYFYDPINLDESFKKHGEKIWFTFNGLRMMNRCERANPVSIVAIQKREE